MNREDRRAAGKPTTQVMTNPNANQIECVSTHTREGMTFQFAITSLIGVEASAQDDLSVLHFINGNKVYVTLPYKYAKRLQSGAIDQEQLIKIIDEMDKPKEDKPTIITEASMADRTKFDL